MLRCSLRSAAVVSVLVAGTSVQGQSPVTVIKGATVLTVTNGTIPNGIVVVRDGKIAAVGASVPIPAGAEVVDATGRFLTPGIIDEHSHIASNSTNEGGTTVSSMTNIIDVLDPGDPNIYRNLAGGLTVASVFHGSANPIGGTNTVIKLRWGKARAGDLVFDAARPGLKFALGENPKDMRQFGQTGPRRYPASRPGVEFVIREAFTRARAYQRAWQEYERRRSAGDDVVAPRRDLQLEPLVEVLEGRRLTHVHAYRSDEMLMMLRLAEEFGFKVHTFEHGLEGYKVAPELAAHGAGVGTFSDWWGYKIEAIDAIPYNAAVMMRAGVLVSINSDSAEHARRLNTEAAKMMKWGGLTEDQALALVTINPARQLQVDKRVGSIEVGKDADLVLWTHHPLSSYAVVDRTYIDGTLYYDRQSDLVRVAEVEKEKAALVAAEHTQNGGTAKAAAAPVPAPAASGVRPPAPRPGDGDLTRLAPKMTAGSLAKGVLAITNAKIIPVSGPDIARGTIVIRDGKIEAVGAGVAVPQGATVIDAAGGEVYPGWINARTTIGLSEPGARGFEDTSEMLDYNPQLRTVVAYHNDSETIPVARANGVTTVAVFPTGGLLGGQVPVMNLDGWTWEESAVRPIAGISFQFPGVGGGGRGQGQAPAGPERTYDDLRKDRDKRLDALVRLFDEARAYAAAGDGRARDWVLEALGPVVDRRIPLFTAASREQDIRDAVALADRAGVRIVLASGPEAALVAPLLKEKNIPVILGSVLTLPSREDQFHAASYQAAGELARAGVRFAFATGDNANVRQLPYQAAISVAWGLPRDEALRALTINAAEILGVSDLVGSIEPGKVANLLIAKGDPLEIRTEISHVIINGRQVDLDNKHLSLYERYLRRK
ncbi:MAG TPA: amidohydrolase family protein [Vicinamibacterales bacterium]|nr:amidohydrolase family protein [Vicinamibacterales bacterium]